MELQEPKIAQGDRRYCIVANWKCNGTTDFVRDIVTNLVNDLEYDTGKLDFVVLPGMLHLNLAKARIMDHVQIGAQNLCAHPMADNFTGEVSAEQLADYEVEWALIGHNERRRHFDESQDIVTAKVEQARAQNIGVIYCVGENQEEYEAERSEEILYSQLQAVKEELDKTDWKKVIIAYEPIWALNTGKIASQDQVHESICMIRDWMTKNCTEEIAKQTRILYGGPVTETNTNNMISLAGVDGFLVGSTSCKPVFRTIFELVHAQAQKDLKTGK